MEKLTLVSNRVWAHALLVAGCVLAGFAGLYGLKIWDIANSTYDAAGQRIARWDETSPFDRELSQWLAKNVKPDEPILPALLPRTELQGKTGHPVLMDSTTLWLMSYMPQLAPTIGAMARDLYGIDYASPSFASTAIDAASLGIGSQAWLRAWRSRTQSEWQTLGQKYNFRLVLAPYDAPLDLPHVLVGPLWTLYRIP